MAQSPVVATLPPGAFSASASASLLTFISQAFPVFDASLNELLAIEMKEMPREINIQEGDEREIVILLIEYKYNSLS